jgi:hypothetical protein
MKTNSNRFVWTFVACALIIATRSAFALGFDYPTGKTVTGSTNWPKGMDTLVNTTNRVHGFGLNAEDVFFFAGDATQFTAFLSDYSRLAGVAGRRLILHEGVGEAKSPWGKAGRPCDWELYACPMGWHNAAVLLKQGTNSVEAIQKAAKAPGYLLEVHLWIGGRIALDQFHIPMTVEFSKEK